MPPKAPGPRVACARDGRVRLLGPVLRSRPGDTGGLALGDPRVQRRRRGGGHWRRDLCVLVNGELRVAVRAEIEVPN